eukprot:gene6802-30773_t
MAKNLLKAGFKVIVCDHSTAAVEKLAQHGALAAKSPRHLAEIPDVSVIVSMLPATEHVKNAYEGPDGLLKADGGVRPWLFVDCSTILPSYSAELESAIHRF